MTAAPGPQQPDEVLCACNHDTLTGRCAEHFVRAQWDMSGYGYACACPRPAAASAQPDECAVDDDRQCTTHRRFHKLCWPDWTPDESAPAQPVRDTREGRR